MSKLNIVPLYFDDKTATFLATPGDHEKLPGLLSWKYRVEPSHPWKDITGADVFGDDRRIARLDPASLDIDPSSLRGKDISLQVTTSGPAGTEVVSEPFSFNFGLVKVVPFELEGGGHPTPEPRPTQVEVSMTRAKMPTTKDEILWSVIRASTNALSVNEYLSHAGQVFADFVTDNNGEGKNRKGASGRFFLGNPDAYRVLRYATELFVQSRCGVMPPRAPLQLDLAEEEARFGHLLPDTFEKMWEDYLVDETTVDGKQLEVLPYLDLIRRKLGDIGTIRSGFAALIDEEAGLLQEKLVHPPMVELIWSYWMEEGMLVQAFNSIVRRFQNLRANGERDPLAQLEIDPLRSVAHLLWGWTQDETGRLSVLRRAHEYDHQYGFSLHGKAVEALHTADRRSKFLEAFHNLLWRCMQFYRQDDDTTVIADGFPVLNALKETHYLLAQGAHNQFPNMAMTARQEMLSQMWILSRPEMREFLGTRAMVPYPEPWMDRVDTVKTLKGWTDTSVVHFRDLAVFGEQILLSVRYGGWSIVNEPANAANWARYWRAEVQGYAHGYRAATGVDLTADVTDQNQAATRFLPPSVHLRNRMLAQSR